MPQILIDSIYYNFAPPKMGQVFSEGLRYYILYKTINPLRDNHYSLCLCECVSCVQCGPEKKLQITYGTTTKKALIYNEDRVWRTIYTHIMFPGV